MILGFALIGGLQSSEYIHTRASLILLTRLVFVFPTRATVGDRIVKALAPLQEANSRPDIKVAAQGYASQLLKARKSGVWREENAAAARARQEQEQRLVEERRKNAEKQSEEMEKESAAITKELGDSRGGGWGDRRGHPRVQHHPPERRGRNGRVSHSFGYIFAIAHAAYKWKGFSYILNITFSNLLMLTHRFDACPIHLSSI